MTLAVHLSSFRFTWIVYLAFTKLHSTTLVLISCLETKIRVLTMSEPLWTPSQAFKQMFIPDRNVYSFIKLQRNIQTRKRVFGKVMRGGGGL